MSFVLVQQSVVTEAQHVRLCGSGRVHQAALCFMSCSKTSGNTCFFVSEDDVKVESFCRFCRCNSRNLRNFPHASIGGWVGSQHLSCMLSRFMSSRVFALAQVFSGVHQIFGCVRQRPPSPRVECGDAHPSCCHAIGLPVEVLCLLVLQGFINSWPSWVAVNRRFCYVERVILISLVVRI